MPKPATVEGNGGVLWYEPRPMNTHVPSNLRISQVELPLD